MKKIYFLIYFVSFLLIGEFLVRIDIKFDILDNAPQKIDIKIEESELIKKVNNDSFKTNKNQIRVLVIGDSYVHGGGINPEEKFSKKLSTLLKTKENQKKEILILDVSRPSNNTTDNFNSFLHYENKFKPQFVFWAYNINDIVGNTKLHKEKDLLSIVTPPKQTKKRRSFFKRNLLKLYANSKLSHYISSQIQRELIVNGIVLPTGDFYSLTQHAYLENNEDWINTQNIISETNKILKKNNSKLILYKMPQFNLLNQLEIFSKIDLSLDLYAKKNNDIIYLDGANDFKNENNSKYLISKYDGHPNEDAHLKIANKIAILINDMVKNSK